MTFPEKIDSLHVIDKRYELFTGKVVGKSRIRLEGEEFFRFKVRVINRYTLASSDKFVDVVTPRLASACGYLFNPGNEYLITSKINPAFNGLRLTSICLRNVLVNKADEEIALIERVLRTSTLFPFSGGEGK